MAKVNLFITDTNFNIFDILNDLLEGKTGGLDNRNLIFCEEKISLMTERRIAEKFGGSFNTDVYSFGNYLRVKKRLSNVLSKEGSSMAIRKILSNLILKCLPQKDGNLAPTLYDLLVLLKSSKITPEDLERSATTSKGVLKNKLIDIAKIFREYDEFLKEKEIEDQSSLLNYLPEIIDSDKEMINTDVYLLGYSSFTEQGREVIKTLIKRAKSVTAILVGGSNDFLYLNETINTFRTLAKSLKLDLEEKTVPTTLSVENSVINNNVFNPKKLKNKIETSSIYSVNAKSPTDEVEVLASTVKYEVLKNGGRYRDFTVVIPSSGGYGEKIKRIFRDYEIPYFLDERKKPVNNPLIKLILSYIECFRKNLEREALSDFYKNPLFCEDKNFSDEFYNYVRAYSVNFGRIKKEFSFGLSEENKVSFENFRLKIVNCFESFNVYKLLEDLSVKEKLGNFSEKLRSLGEIEEAEINDQIYDYVIKLLSDMDVLLSGLKISYADRKRIFISGVNALELSIIPQYKDAVFIGGFKEASLAKAKNLYVLGLTSDLPKMRDDVALLNDKDIKILSGVNVKIEPNIKIVNDREKENAGLALCSFSDKLFLSYPALTEDGSVTFKSRILESLSNLFALKDYYYKGEYLTFDVGAKSFALACKKFADGKTVDFTDASDFYYINKENQKVISLLNRAEKQIDGRLKNPKTALTDYVSSPTAIEDFYACPYKAFIKKALSVKETDEGKLDGAKTGNLLHEVMNGYLGRYNEVVDEESFNKVVEEEILKVLSKDEYKRYKESENPADLERVLRETRSYAKKTNDHFKDSSFKPTKLEVGVNLPILDGEVNLYGKVDRIDESDDYYRVVDYKTGSYDVSSEALFTGNKLQLYLYSKMAELKGTGDKKLAGLFYAPVKDAYEDRQEKNEFLLDGKVLDEDGVLSLHGEKDNDYTKYIKISSRTKKSVSLTADALTAHVKYAIKMCEKAVERMKDGLVASSPYKGACDFCAFSAVCERENFPTRKALSVCTDTIVSAVEEEK